MRHNVEPLVELVFRGSLPPLAVLDGSDCTSSGEFHPESKYKEIVFKLLTTVWQHERVFADGRYGMHNTVHRKSHAPFSTPHPLMIFRPRRCLSMIAHISLRAIPKTLQFTPLSGVLWRRTQSK